MWFILWLNEQGRIVLLSYTNEIDAMLDFERCATRGCAQLIHPLGYIMGEVA